MSAFDLEQHVREIISTELPFAHMNAVERFKQLFSVAREDLSLAKLAEAHWDAVAILAEAGRVPHQNALYAVWASEIPGKTLQIEAAKKAWTLSGTKMFCSGAGMVDRALISANGILIDLDLSQTTHLQIDSSSWQTSAFKDTQTSSITFAEIVFKENDIIAENDWYVERPGFWLGAVGPAACWAGGAAGLVDYAMSRPRNDAHTLAHLAAMAANIWAMESFLHSAGVEITHNEVEVAKARILALKTRHLIEQLCTDTLRRFARAYGPFPLACDAAISRRYQELDLFLRQNHAERDLESLGKMLVPA